MGTITYVLNGEIRKISMLFSRKMIFSGDMIPVLSSEWEGARGSVDTLGSSLQFLKKRDNFCDFLFAFPHSKPFQKRGLLLEERICSNALLKRNLQ